MGSAVLDQVVTGGVHQRVDGIDVLDPNETLDGRLCNLDGYPFSSIARDQTDLSDAVGRAGLHFEGKPYPVSVRPYVLSDACADEVITASEWLVRVLDVVAEMYRDEQAVRELFPSCRSIEKYSVSLPDFRPLVRICRLDGLFAADGIYKFLETNTDCPGGIIQNGVAAQVWAQQRNSLVEELDLHVGAQPFAVDTNAFTLELLNAHKSRTGELAKRAAIVNYRGRYTNETDWMVRSLQALGVDAKLVDAASLSHRDGRLYDGTGKPVDLTYNKYELRDFIGEPEVLGYLEAAAAGNVTFLNSLIAQWVLSDKAIFAVLTDERFASNFSMSDREMIRRHVLWTRLVEDRETRAPSRRRISLLRFIADNRASLVLKPVNATRGEGVLIGKYASADEWSEVLSRALNGTPYVVQEHVEPPAILAVHPEMGVAEMASGLDVYVFGGKFAGFQARASVDPVMNIGRRGILLPVVTRKGYHYAS